MAEMLTGGLRNQKSNIREQSSKEFMLESGETTSSFSTEQDKMVFSADCVRKCGIKAEKVLFMHTCFLSYHSKTGGGRKVKAKFYGRG